MSHRNFKITFFVSPVLCAYCSDYIWGSGFVGYTCDRCFIVVHSQCKNLFVIKTQRIGDEDECQENSYIDNKRRCIEDSYRIEKLWSFCEVKEWLAVVNLHRYSEVFAKSEIDGDKLFKINKKALADMRIHDSFHHDAIMAAIEELQIRSRITYETMKENEVSIGARRHQQLIHSAANHNFLIATLTKIHECNVCNRPLLGIMQQGLICTQCGLTVHRQCSYLGLCVCSPKTTRTPLIQYYVFGVSLSDLMNEYMAPALLQKAFENIEKRALESNEDLYDAYRLSAETYKIDKFKQKLNENGVDLVQFTYYDLNTVAAIVKAFLRELQDSVIPEDEYKPICRLISKKCSRSEFVGYINSLHPVHLKCLSFVMCHLIRVWRYQYEHKSSKYLPDKLIHIFRTIIMRPPWSSIIDVVYNLEIQSQVMKRLFLEYDWGIELPKFKDRPDVPASPPSQPLVISSLVRNVNSYVKAFDLMGSSNATETMQNGFYEMPWYWSDVTRDDTLMLLKDCRDGAYLVRDSTEKQTLLNRHSNLTSLFANPKCLANNSDTTTPAAYTSLEPPRGIPDSASVVAPYTLCILKGSSIKSIKIFYDLKTNLYDIEVPCRFENVKMLIDYYTINSLKEYNINLDVKLTEGLSKYKYGKTTEWNIDRLYSSFRDAFRQFENSARKSEGIEIEIETLYQDLKNKHLANHAFENIIKLYEEQIDSLKSNLIKFQQSSMEKQNEEEIIVENIEHLTGRIDDLNTKRQELVVDCDYLNTIIQQLQDELEQLRPDLIQLRKKRENYHMWLLQRGEDDEKIMKTLNSPSLPQEQQNLFGNTIINSMLESPHEDSNNWYRANMSRDEAESVLKNRPNGTFLVRTSKNKLTRKLGSTIQDANATNNSNTPNSSLNSLNVRRTYVLSVVHNSSFIHLLIDEDDEGSYIRLTENKGNFKKFSTLKNLVVNYSKNSLKSYTVDVCLAYPAFTV